MKYKELKHYKYQLMDDFTMNVDLGGQCLVSGFIKLGDGFLWIGPRYCWDGSSVPLKKYIKWIWDCDKYCKTASLVHDALCQLIREGLLPMSYKQRVDEIYRDMCIKGGMGKLQANIRYKCLRKFGDPFVIKKPDDPKGKIWEEYR